MTSSAIIRTFQPGDMGHIAGAQAALYAEGYGWGRPLEILILETVAQFLRDYAQGRDQCFVAEMNGRVVGSCFVTDDGDGRARLRLVYVDAAARGQGLGQRLVAECVDFARGAGYRAVWLWTHAVLESARRIYAGAGFRCIERFTHDEFGVEVNSENWELILE
ncbi:GNAT family N-acetyltransferase [Sphingomonas crocodyli]|nr:GNAT family N-acetyltransferase [Sphingomonas crocodyli]